MLIQILILLFISPEPHALADEEDIDDRDMNDDTDSYVVHAIYSQRLGLAHWKFMQMLHSYLILTDHLERN